MARSRANAEYYGESAPLDFREYFVDDTIVRDHLAESCLEAQEELRDSFTIAADERNAHFLAFRSQCRSADRRDCLQPKHEAWRKAV
jgi:hypothetical protein